MSTGIGLKKRVAEFVKSYNFCIVNGTITDGEALRATRAKLLMPGKHEVAIVNIEQTLTIAESLIDECNRSLQKSEVDSTDYTKLCAVYHACTKMIARPDLRITQKFQAA